MPSGWMNWAGGAVPSWLVPYRKPSPTLVALPVVLARFTVSVSAASARGAAGSASSASATATAAPAQAARRPGFILVLIDCSPVLLSRVVPDVSAHVSAHNRIVSAPADAVNRRNVVALLPGGPKGARAVDLDLRKVRYFVAVAEQLNFGRAAQALHIAQPVLSRQIRALEQELKVRLLERDKRATRLTPAGEALLEDGRALLAAADAARRRVSDADAGTRVFTVGFMPGLIVTPAVREFSRLHPEVRVEVLRTDWLNQTDTIHDGTVDVGYL